MRKEKNLIYIESEKSVGKEYVIDIATGTVYGLAGKPIKSVNREILVSLKKYHYDNRNIFTRNLVNWFDNDPYYREEDLECLQFAERLYNMGWKGQEHIYSADLEFIKAHMKAFLKWFKANPDVLYLSRFRDNYERQIFIEKYAKYVPTNNAYPIERLASSFGNNEFFNKLEENEKVTYITLFFKFVLPFYERLDNPTSTDTIYNSFYLLNELFEYAKALKVKVDKGDFFKQYLALKKCYKVKKADLDKQALIDNQLKHAKALSFSNDMFEVVIPTTEKEFEDEANAQGNCVYSSYYPKVIKGETNVVFIRRKDELDKSYITCEVCRGSIYQYLGRHNYHIHDTLALNFKIEYAKHLKEWWGE